MTDVVSADPCTGQVVEVVAQQTTIAEATTPSRRASSASASAQSRLARPDRPTCYQLRLFGAVLEEGSHLAAAIDHAGPTLAETVRGTGGQTLLDEGIAAIGRFLRPVTWQGAPQEVLPEELQHGFPRIPRRIDAVLELPR